MSEEPGWSDVGRVRAGGGHREAIDTAKWEQ